ncbi:hypothetical protein KKC1_24190 [Calderihabitans maritimus]|uniref:Uncharacterized protein n=1 Tax=Calderihabitans maritimus TaxID=1246530 RepID=A0A1Z5HVG7_9FIRM|nr:hypothetical protein KKC1_24190 [Calderihabitans maritimus]
MSGPGNGEACYPPGPVRTRHRLKGEGITTRRVDDSSFRTVDRSDGYILGDHNILVIRTIVDDNGIAVPGRLQRTSYRSVGVSITAVSFRITAAIIHIDYCGRNCCGGKMQELEIRSVVHVAHSVLYGPCWQVKGILCRMLKSSVINGEGIPLDYTTDPPHHISVIVPNFNKIKLISLPDRLAECYYNGFIHRNVDCPIIRRGAGDNWGLVIHVGPS